MQHRSLHQSSTAPGTFTSCSSFHPSQQVYKTGSTELPPLFINLTLHAHLTFTEYKTRTSNERATILAVLRVLNAPGAHAVSDDLSDMQTLEVLKLPAVLEGGLMCSLMVSFFFRF